MLETGIQLMMEIYSRIFPLQICGRYFQPTSGYPQLSDLELRFSCLRELGQMLYQQRNCIGLIESSNFTSDSFIKLLLQHCKSWNDQIPSGRYTIGFSVEKLETLPSSATLFDHPSRQFVDSDSLDSMQIQDTAISFLNWDC